MGKKRKRTDAPAHLHAVRNAFAGLPLSVQFPFAGLPIGKAMRATKKAIETNTPVP